MPILELQKRARELGRIRIGQVVGATEKKRGRPEKLDRFRLTSHSETLIKKCAELYGGEARPWSPQGGGADQWEVITDSNRIPILVPPQPVTQWLETWSGGGCVHRCDGVTNAITGEPCDGGAAHDAARPTTRLNVVLRDVEGIGVWRLESHGWNAAVELPDVAAFLAEAGGYINGWIGLEERVSKSDGQTRRFMVPIIEVAVTPAELLSGAGRIVAAPTVEGPVQTPEIESRPDYVAEAQAANSLDEVRAIYARANTAGHLDDVLQAQLVAIGKVYQKVAEPVSVEQGPVDAQPERTPGEIWDAILKVAVRMSVGLNQLRDDFARHSGGVLAEDAGPVEMEAFLTDLEAGRVSA